MAYSDDDMSARDGFDAQHVARHAADPSAERDEETPAYGHVTAPLPAAVGGRRSYSASMPTPKERRTAFVVAGLCMVLAVCLLVWGVTSALNFDANVDADAAATDDAGVEEEVPVETQTLTLTMAGDMVLHPSVYESGLQDDGSYDLSHLFANVGDLLTGDLVLLSQETPLAGEEYSYGYSPVFNAPQAVGDAEVEAGVNVVLKASEHTLDEGYDGLHSEMEFWAREHPEVSVLGVRDVEADDPGSFDDVYVFEKDGFTVAVLNYNAETSYTSSDSEGAVATLSTDQLSRNVEEAERQADIVVVCPHWGTDAYTSPTADQTTFGELCLSLGVDAVIGTHPHVLEPVEVLTDDDGNRCVCYWSIGSFVSGYSGSNYNVGGIAQLTLVKDPDGSAYVSGYGLTPVVTHKGSGTDETVYPLADYTDELASTNQNGLAVATAESVAESALGGDYDSVTKTLWVDLS